MKIFVASDHGGFTLKQFLVKHFAETGAEFEDLGPFEVDEHDDYPDYAIKLGEQVAVTADSLGILICRNGAGVCFAVNKVKGIRAGLSWSVFHAQSLKNDDNTNVLCLAADFVDNEKALEIVGTWLSTPFSAEPRHQRRIDKVSTYENK
jgi:ribose 5-phosphate isomerase B